MNYFRRIRDATICVALLIMPFFFLSSNLKDPSKIGPVDKLVLQASAPIQYVATEVSGAVSGLLEEYVYLVEVKRENDRLRIESDRFKEENRQLRVQASENRRMRDLLQLRERLATETISARVIGNEISPFFRITRIRLDRGERDRVKQGMPVVSAQGLVGQIRRTAGRYADVLLTVDRNSAVDIIIQRTGARGMLRGTGENDQYASRIQYLQRTDEVQVGDEVYTSGFGLRFPPSILVGRVTEVKKKTSGLYQEATVTPSVNFSEVEEVLILTSGSREQDATRSRLEDAPEEEQ